MNNLQIFRKELDSLTTNEQIADREQWYQLMERLCDLKLLNPNQAKILKQHAQKRSFPVTIYQLEEIIMKQFGNEQNKALLNDLVSIQKQIRQTKGVLTIWKDKGLTNGEINALNILFAKGNSKMKQICQILSEKKQIMESVCQQQIQLIKSMEEWILMQKINKVYKDYVQFQQLNEQILNSLFNRIRVREVHFKNKKQKGVQKGHGIFSLTAFDSKNDEPVEVTKIDKKGTNFDEINEVLMTFNAHKDMLLSPYFLRFKGFNNLLDHQYFLYFREYQQSVNLRFIVYESSYQLDEEVALFKFWAGEIFRALRDLFMMCSYYPVLPIKLSDFHVADYGLRVILKDIKFQGFREGIDQTLEPELLQNVGYLLLELLKIGEQAIPQKVKNIENISLLNTLLKAKEGHRRFEQKIVPCQINFFNAQTHPLFQSIQQTQGIQIINNFTVLYGDYL